MSWCPYCVWNRIGVDGQQALLGLPSRLPAPVRNRLSREDLIELGTFHANGTIWRSTPRGRAVVRAGRE